MASNLQRRIHDRLWLTPLCFLLLLFGSVIYFVHLPLGIAVAIEGRRLYSHFVKKRNAAYYPHQERLVHTDIALLDSVSRQIESNRNRQEGALLDDLYRFSDISGFKTVKVEVGGTRSAGDHIETPVSIIGNSSYRAIGSFVELIENCRQSTRINQLDIKRCNDSNLEAFIDVTVRDEIMENPLKRTDRGIQPKKGTP